MPDDLQQEEEQLVQSYKKYKELCKELADYLYSITYENNFAFLPHENCEYEVKELLSRVYNELDADGDDYT